MSDFIQFLLSVYSIIIFICFPIYYHIKGREFSDVVKTKWFFSALIFNAIFTIVDLF